MNDSQWIGSRPVCESADDAFLPTGVDPGLCSNDCPVHGVRVRGDDYAALCCGDQVTVCCGAYATFGDDGTLCCKACWRQVGASVS